MTFITTLIALIIERFFDWSHLRNQAWFYKFKLRLDQYLAERPYFSAILALLIPTLVVLFFQFIFYSLWYGIIGLVFNLLILIYCLGSRNLWADSFLALNVIEHADSATAANTLAVTFDITDVQTPQTMYDKLMMSIFTAANRRIFAVVFWFVVAGAWACVFYRSLCLLVDGAEHKQIELAYADNFSLLLKIVEWLPVRLLIIIFALAGNFVKVINTQNQANLKSLDANQLILQTSGIAAISHESGLPHDSNAVKSALALIDRALIIVLVLIAIATILI